MIPKHLFRVFKRSKPNFLQSTINEIRYLSNRSNSTVSHLNASTIPASRKDCIRTEKWCYTKAEKYECEYTWIIQDYSANVARICRGLRSSAFSAANDPSKWSIDVRIKDFYNDQLENDENWLCMSLYLERERIDEFEPISGNVTVSLIDSSNQKANTDQENFLVEFLHGDDNNISTLKFIKCDNLISKKDVLLPEDELRIHCKLHFNRELVNFTSTNDVPIQTDESNNVTHDLEKLLNDKESSDLMINVNGKDYPAHRTILAARSPVFKAMFKDDTTETQQNRIEIKDIDENIFEEVLRYIYTGRVENLKDTALELLPVAEKFNLEHLKNMCVSALSMLLSENTAVKILILSDLSNAEGLKTRAIEYIKANLLEVMRSEDWNDLSSNKDLMKCLLNSD
ncbi:speckle-type POZ protein B-like [Planococcus citri]|uniref:speckle-type POZ protein B-like n=1 Tax=Planococcus citri TaxID=170843 RepID=UPI0031F92C11